MSIVLMEPLSLINICICLFDILDVPEMSSHLRENQELEGGIQKRRYGALTCEEHRESKQ